MPKLLHTISLWKLTFLFFLLPLFFLPFTQDYYETNKWALFILGSFGVTILWAIDLLRTNRVKVAISPGSLGFGVLALAALLSLFFVSPNKVEALINPFGFATFLAASLYLLLGGTVVDAKGKMMLRWGLIVSATVLGLMAIYQFFGIGKAMFPAVTFLQSPLWTPVGTTFALIAWLVVSLPLLGHELLASKNKNETVFIISILLGLVQLAALGFTLYQVIPNLGTLMPLSTAWAVLLEIMKRPMSLFFGVGAENYLGAYTIGRPPALNATNLWNARFTAGASSVFHIATTLGVGGLVGLAVLTRAMIPSWKTKNEQLLSASLVVGAIVLFFFPPTIATFILLVALLLSSTQARSREVSLHIPSHLAWISGLVGFVLLGAIGFSLFLLFRNYQSEVTFYRSLKAIQANNGTDAYNLQIKATGENPYIARYHMSFSQTNLALANAIASGKDATGSATLSDADRQTISQLIQQAIREGKIGTELAPASVIAWETLASTYQSILGIAQGSDQWAIAAFQQAISLDPGNPILRVNLASVYLQTQNYDAALQNLSTAAFLKPNIPNVHYNIAYIYRLRKEYLKEAVALQQTISLVPAGSADATKLQEELEKAKSLLTEDELAIFTQTQKPQGTPQNSELGSPLQGNQPTIEPRLELPADASPDGAR